MLHDLTIKFVNFTFYWNLLNEISDEICGQSKYIPSLF